MLAYAIHRVFGNRYRGVYQFSHEGLLWIHNFMAAVLNQSVGGVGGGPMLIGAAVITYIGVSKP